MARRRGGIFSEGIPILKDLPGVGQFFRFGNDPQGELVDEYSDIQQKYEQMRGPMREARMNALTQTLSLFDPMNNLLVQQYGPSAGMDFSQVFKSPYPEEEKEEKEPTPVTTNNDKKKTPQATSYDRLVMDKTGDTSNLNIPGPQPYVPKRTVFDRSRY